MELKLDNGKVLTVKLVKDGNDLDIVVTSVDGKTEYCGILLSILSSGKFKRVGSVGGSTGLKLNSSGQIKEDKQ